MTKLGPNLKLGTRLLVVVFIVSSLALYGGARLVAEDEPEKVANGGADACAAPDGPVTVEIAAKNIQFDRDCFAAQAGVEVKVAFDNQDLGIFHNVAFYTNSRALEPLFPGQMKIFPGPEIREVGFTAPTATGNYFFRCDVHPDTMKGSFKVRSAPPRDQGPAVP